MINFDKENAVPGEGLLPHVRVSDSLMNITSYQSV